MTSARALAGTTQKGRVASPPDCPKANHGRHKHHTAQARPMMEAVAINSSSKARETLPDTEYGSSPGYSANKSKLLELILDMLTCPIVQPPKRRSEISS